MVTWLAMINMGPVVAGGLAVGMGVSTFGAARSQTSGRVTQSTKAVRRRLMGRDQDQ